MINCGSTASAGCVRLTVEDTKWIYDNCPIGTMVEFYSSSDPGPLGKPTAQKISSNEECRNWDPTDPAKNNPWHTYTSDKIDIKNNNTLSNTINNINVNKISTENTITSNEINNNVLSDKDNDSKNNQSNNNTSNENIMLESTNIIH